MEAFQQLIAPFSDRPIADSLVPSLAVKLKAVNVRGGQHRASDLKIFTEMKKNEMARELN